MTGEAALKGLDIAAAGLGVRFTGIEHFRAGTTSWIRKALGPLQLLLSGASRRRLVSRVADGAEVLERTPPLLPAAANELARELSS